MASEVYTFHTDNKRIIVRPFEKSDSISEITGLLRRSYKQLADLGFKYLATHQDDFETERRLNNGISYLGICEEKIIATISLYYLTYKHRKPKWYTRKDVAYFGQFGVDPKFQGKGLGNFIMDFIENKAKQLGASEIALDTAEDAKHLIRYYNRRGYRFIEYVNWDVTNYRSVILSKNLLQ